MNWINVKDQLPNASESDIFDLHRSKEVLLFANGKISIGYLQYNWLVDDGTECSDDICQWYLQGRDGYLAKEVTHWAELPDPPG